jgi:hypothetical protein
VPNNAWYLYEVNEWYEPDRVGYYTSLELGAQVGWFFAGGAIRTDILPNSLGNYDPHWATYDFSAGIRIREIEIGYRHRCTHPIQTYLTGQHLLQTPVVEGSYDEFYVRIAAGHRRRLGGLHEGN